MKFVAPLIAAAALTAGASASFTHFSVVAGTNGNGNSFFDVFAEFDSSSNVLLNCFQINDLGGTLNVASAIHNDFGGGTWAPQASNNSTNDSYVQIGGAANFSNSTSADPNWGGAGFNQPGIPNGAGWFNSNPPNLQGQAVGGHVQIARFIFAPATNGQIRTYFLKVGYNSGLGTTTVFGEGTFTIGVPAPGAVALLGLAGLVGRRRRA